MSKDKVIKCKKCKAPCLTSVAKICNWDTENKLCPGCKLINPAPDRAGGKQIKVEPRKEDKMFTNEEIKWFIEAACGQWVEGCKVEEGDNGIVIVTEPDGKVHEVRAVCSICGDATGTCEHATG